MLHIMKCLKTISSGYMDLLLSYVGAWKGQDYHDDEVV